MGCEPDPSVLLPLLLGLSRSTGARRDGTSSSSSAGGGRTAGKKRRPESAPAATVGGDGPDAAVGNENESDDEVARIASLPLPTRLHRLLAAEGPAAAGGMAWTSHGRSFRIRDGGDDDGDGGERAFREGLGAYFPASEDDDVIPPGGTGGGSDTGAGSEDPPPPARFWSRETLHRTLLGYGFRITRSQSDAGGNGCYYHPRFLRGREDLADGLDYDPARVPKGADESAKSGKGGGTDATSPSPAAGSPPGGSAPEVPAAVRDFMAFTSASDPDVAGQYLEMAGGDVGTAVSLYMDTGGGAGASGEDPMDAGLARALQESAAASSSSSSGGADESKAATRGEGDDDDDEPDLCALPAMPPLPLPERPHAVLPGEEAVTSALREFWAYRTIRRALVRWLGGRRTVPPSEEPAEETAGLTSTDAVPPPAEAGGTAAVPATALARASSAGGLSHFLFRSLVHPSMPVRRAAARLVLDNLHFIRPGANSGGATSGLRSFDPTSALVEAVLALLHVAHFGAPPWRQPAGPPPGDGDPSLACGSRPALIPPSKLQSEGGDPSAQLAALLLSLVTDGGFPGPVVASEVRGVRDRVSSALIAPGARGGGRSGPPPGPSASDAVARALSNRERILCATALSDMGRRSIESFVAGGGLRWACGSILGLVGTLVRGSDGGGDHGHGGDPDGPRDGPGHVESATVQGRIWLLVDLVYRCVLYGTVPGAVDGRLLLGVGGGDGPGGQGPSAIPPGPPGLGLPPPPAGGAAPTSSAAAQPSDAAASRRAGRERLGRARRMVASAASSRAALPPPPQPSSSASSSSGIRPDLAGLLSGGAGSLGGEGGRPPAAAAPGSTARRSRPRRTLGLPRGGGGVDARGRAVPNNPYARASTSGGGEGGGGGGGGGGDPAPPSPAAAEEDARRRDRRRATLEKVHELLWTGKVPAAVCVPRRVGGGGASMTPMRTSSSTATLRAGSAGAPDPRPSPPPVPASADPSSVQPLTPMACLVASYEILRSDPVARPSLSVNAACRAAARKGIATLARIVDPGATSPIVSTEEADAGVLAAAAGLVGGPNPAPTSTARGGSAGGKRRRDTGSRAGRSPGRGPPSAGSPAAGPRPHKRARRTTISSSTSARRGIGLGSAASPDPAPSDGSILSPGGAAAAMSAGMRQSLALLAGGGGGARQGGRSGGGAASPRQRERDALSQLLLMSAGRGSRGGGGGGGNNPMGSPSSQGSRSRARNQAPSSLLGGNWDMLEDNDRADPMDVDGGGGAPPDGGGAGEEEEEDDEMYDVDGDDDDGGDDGGEPAAMESSSDESEPAGGGAVPPDDPDGGRGGGTGSSDPGEEGDDAGQQDGEGDEEQDSEAEEEEEGDGEEEIVDDTAFDDAVIHMEDLDAGNDASGPGGGTAASSSSGHAPGGRSSNPHRRSGASRTALGSPLDAALQRKRREQAYLVAAMQTLSAQYPDLYPKDPTLTSRVRSGRRCNPRSALAGPFVMTPPLLTQDAEQSLLKSMSTIIRPPRKPLNLKIFMRRAPTQEEFFRGNLTKNPVGLGTLRGSSSSSNSGGGGEERRSSGGGGNGDGNEPRVRDLRMHIAKDLQMEDSAELLELLVANKILDLNLKLRVVQQVLWKKYVEENATSASSLVAGAGPSHQMISTGSGLSMIFNSSRARSAGADDNAILATYPPMVVTYRLAGVDGEATEDTVEDGDLDDPEAPNAANSTPAAIERRNEKEYGLTRLITKDRGAAVLLDSVKGTIDELLRRIRRDEVSRRHRLRDPSAAEDGDGNRTRELFSKAPPCPGLVLLRHCANIADNRKKLLANRAPTLLLRILLDILNAMNRDSGRSCRRARADTFDFGAVDDVGGGGSAPSARGKKATVEGNPTTDALQEIIEMLASDISSEIGGETSSGESSSLVRAEGSFADLGQAKEGGQISGNDDEDRTLPLVMKSLHSTELSPPLRKVIAKLLPFLTYGQVSQSRDLATYFLQYVDVNALGAPDSDPDEDGNNDCVLMSTFVDTATNLPPVSVCDNIRRELIRNGFVSRIRSFLVEGAPSRPPPWSPALYAKTAGKMTSAETDELREEWRKYLNKRGLDVAFKMLTGLCTRHPDTQCLLADASDDSAMQVESADGPGSDLLSLCHWIESTSDNTASGIQNPNGILAETLLDHLKEDNDVTSRRVNAVRKETRDRKKELAEERRNKALVGMSTFGTLPGASGGASSGSAAGGMFASMISSLTGGAGGQQQRTRSSKSETAAASASKAKPAWMAEMEAMEDETLACAVCQEGRTLQPSELLGLYAYMKKVTVSGVGGSTGNIDGTVLLLSLPVSFPSSLLSTDSETLFEKARNASNALEGSSQALTSMSAANNTSSSRNSCFVTTVSAGNAIHISCHKKAKAADRSHPKAPKSEWEGASLRNSRVTCNVIVPLVSSKASEVSLLSIETALAEYNAHTTNTLGARPKSTLWNCLHDIRFLLLRMAYGENLGADCGGGSSTSNNLLLLHQMNSADLFAINAEHDESLEVSRHAKGLSAGFLVACEMVESPNFDRTGVKMKRLERGVAASAPMAALLSILFYNSDDKSKPASRKSTNSQWETHMSRFLTGLIRCAGQRHALGLSDSGCVTSRGLSTGNRKNAGKARSFVDWSDVSGRSKPSHKSSMIEEYSRDLRPLITLYVLFGELSKEFVANKDDEGNEESSERLAAKLEDCYKSSNIHDLLDIAGINMDHGAICRAFEKGARSIS